MHIVASIQARLGSTRLPGKVLFHLGDRRVLQWCIDRTTAAEAVDETIVTTGNRPENDAIKRYCERADTAYSVGPEENLLARHHAVAERTGCDLLVRITGDCPFVPCSEIDRVVENHISTESRYTSNSTKNMPTGTAVDVMDAGLLRELRTIGETHPVTLARSNPKEWGTVLTDNPSWEDVSDAHIAVDTPKDYWSLQDAVDVNGDDPYQIAKWVA